MRTIREDDLIASIAEAFQYISYFHPPDFIRAMSAAWSREENPGAKIVDSILGEIPLIGFLTGYFCHPKYLATRNNGTPAMRLTKQPAFWEGRFQIDKLSDLTPREELNLFLSYLMLVLLERRRG